MAKQRNQSTYYWNLNMKINSIAILGTAMAALTLVGCNRTNDSQTAGQKVDAAAAEVKRDAGQVNDAAGKAVTEVKQAAGAAVTAVQDTAITAGIKAKLAGDADLKTRDISVETTAGRAVLRGTAPDTAAQSRAKELAAAVSGVTGVDNQLTVLR